MRYALRLRSSPSGGGVERARTTRLPSDLRLRSSSFHQHTGPSIPLSSPSLPPPQRQRRGDPPRHEKADRLFDRHIEPNRLLLGDEEHFAQIEIIRRNVHDDQPAISFLHRHRAEPEGVRPLLRVLHQEDLLERLGALGGEGVRELLDGGVHGAVAGNPLDQPVECVEEALPHHVPGQRSQQQDDDEPGEDPRARDMIRARKQRPDDPVEHRRKKIVDLLEEPEKERHRHHEGDEDKDPGEETFLHVAGHGGILSQSKRRYSASPELPPTPPIMKGRWINDQTFSRAWFRSSIRSSAASIPMEKRIMESVIPLSSRSSGASP